MPPLHKLLFAIAILLYGQLSGQTTCIPVFQKIYGGQPTADDEAIAITYCKGGGMIVCGETTSYTSGQYDGLLLKLADNGTPEWTRIIGGAGLDRLIQVRQTTDGGFIALGETRSFANQSGEAWLVKTDAQGNILWNRRYGQQTSHREKPKDIIQLKDGGYCLAVNAADSTIAGNAMIIRTTSTGNVVWVRVLDNGGDDGVNNIAEYNDTLLVAGYATGDGRDAIVTKLLKSDGSLINASRIRSRQGYSEEAISIEVVNNSIAFGVTSSISTPQFSLGGILDYYRLADNGTVLYQRRATAGTSSGTWIQSVQTRATDDMGFIYLVNDTTRRGFSTCEKVGPYGQPEWGREFSDYSFAARTTGMDFTGNQGYVFAGYKNDYQTTSMRNKIQVFKTNRVGKTGKCPLNLALYLTDTAQTTIANSGWKSVQAFSVQESANAMNIGNDMFTVTSSCEDQVCETAQALQDGCSNTLNVEYKSELNFTPADVTKLADGSYAMAGDYSYYWNLEPSIIKTKPNGSIAWAKTFNEFAHDARFVRIVPAKGNTFIAMGHTQYNINHIGTDSAILMKIDYNGIVLWSKRYGRGSGTIFGDMQATDDGGCVIIENENSGSGTGASTVIARLDGNGNFVWKKQVNTHSLIIRKLLFDNNAVYTCGTASVYTTSGWIGQLSIVKLDAATGDYIWQKQLRSAAFSQTIYAFSLEKAGDTLLASIQLTTPLSTYQTKTEGAFAKINASNGNLYSAFKLTNLFHLPTPDYTLFNTVWTSLSGSDIIFGNKAVVGTDTSLYITRVTSNGQLVWSKKYGNLNKHTVSYMKHVDDGILLTGSKTLGLLDVNVRETYAFLLKVNEKGDVSDNPTSPACINTDFKAIVDTLTLVEGNKEVNEVINLQEGIYNSSLSYKDIAPYNRDIHQEFTVFCSKAANCTTVSIAGPDSVCDFRMPIQYSLVRNAGCDAAAVWLADTSMARIVAVTDSTISLLYKKAGSAALKAAITSGCTGLSAEKTVSITRQAASLNLGLDTVLCANMRDTLRAGTGYKSYSWSHNGSTDSVAVISSPGMYILSVTDFCGGTFSDTVNVKPARFPFSAGPDTSKCNRDSVVLKATAGFVNYTWQPAYNLQKVSPSVVQVFPAADTDYIVQAEKWAGCFVRDTVHITVHTSQPLSLGRDTSFCAGQSLPLQAAGNFSSYQWSTGDTQPGILVQKAGTYTVQATTSEGCHSRDTIVISANTLPVVSLDHNAGICTGTTRTLDAGNYVSYLWQDGSAGRMYPATRPGTFYVQVTDRNGCTGSDTARIRTQYPLPAGFLPADTSICSYNTISLQPARSYRAYKWNTGQTTGAIKIDRPGTYWLQVQDDNDCMGSDSMTVALRECRLGLFVPTAFTPNNDGKNDKLRALIYGNLRSYDFRVFNRFGQLVFHTTDPLQGWDGKLNGLDQDPGVYVWVCAYQLDTSKATGEKGTTLLIR